MRQAVWGAVALLLGVGIAVATMPREEVEAAALDEEELSRASVAIDERPDWEMGDAWRVQFDEGDPVCWLVVVTDDEEGAQQGIACETDETDYVAANVASAGVPYLGFFDPDLGGVVEGDTTRFYDWPLEDGKSWETTFQGNDVEVRCSLSEKSGRYQLIMSEGGDDFLIYDYDPDLEWWNELRFKGGYTFRVVERDEGWSGPVVVAHTQTRYEQFAQSALLGAPAAPMEVADEDEVLALWLTYTGTNAGRFELRDASGSPQYQQGVSGEVNDFALVAASPGSWTVLDAVTGLGDHRVRVSGIAYERFDL